MKITLKDGSCKRICRTQCPVIDIAKDISEGLARVACAGEVDGEVVDLRTTMWTKTVTLNILTFDDEAGRLRIPTYLHPMLWQKL